MNLIYLDNAATTPMAPEVITFMQAAMEQNFGNPSSTHQFGRKAKTAVETARKQIAKHLNATANEIIFTAGGTEADNLILYNAVVNLGVQHIITAATEHHAVTHTVAHLENTYQIKIHYVNVNEQGDIDLKHLEELLAGLTEKALVSLMHVNNEIGNILPVVKVGELCKKYHALFHSDTVQAVGHYPIDLQELPIDFLVASAHKFHGPKGVGFAYFRKGFGITPLLHGGDQEKGARSSTENVHAILGMEKALTLITETMEEDHAYINELKAYFIEGLQHICQEVAFNGRSGDLAHSSYTILNVRFPFRKDMLLFSLDLAGIAVSGGSACQSGSNQGSHVLNAILDEEAAEQTSIRFSFSKYTTKEDLTLTLEKLKELL